MANYGIKIDLQKIQGAFIKEIKGRTASKRCICIPIDGCDYIFPGEKGTYLKLTAFEMREPKYDDTHMIKPSLNREIRGKMTDEQRNSITILGGLKELKRRDDFRSSDYPGHLETGAPSPGYPEYDNSDVGKDDLPF